MENHLDNEMENEMETGLYKGLQGINSFILIPSNPHPLVFLDKTLKTLYTYYIYILGDIIDFTGGLSWYEAMNGN